MKDIYEVLRLKENEMSRVEVEVEALRLVASLLSDDEETAPNSPTTSGSTVSLQPVQVPEAANSNPQPDHSPEWRSRGWARP
jgi:DNA-binding transcriptional regulator of glucitol operon